MSYNHYYESVEVSSLPVYCHCLPVEIPSCVETFYFPTIYLETELLFYFVDKFNKEYLYLATTDNQGWAGIETYWFPPGLFNPHAGKFSVFFTSSIEPKSERKYFKAPDGLYPCIELKVIDTVYTNILANTEFYSDLKKYYCCCERICPPPAPNCDNPKELTF